MKRILLFLISLIALTSCNPNLNKNLEIKAIDQYNHVKDNPFNDPIEISNNSKAEDFSFLLVTDTHIGKGDGKRIDKEFLSYLEENGKSLNLSFIVNLGDITDNATRSEFTSFIDASLKPWQEATDTSLFIPLLGNHDNRIDGPYLFKELFNKRTTYYRFDYNGVSFYILDSSFRTLGKTQLKLFEKAMEESDKETPKVILSHIPLHGNDTVFYAALVDSNEIRKIVQAMRKGGARVYLSGHQHKGEIQYTYKANNKDESINELIASCFFGGTIRNLTARFYICNYKVSERVLSIDVYSFIDNSFKEEKAKYNFPL